MTYKDIPGWFNFEEIYDRAVDRAPDFAKFVEVGCWLGKSTAYLASRIADSGKAIKLYAVDHFQGDGTEKLDEVVREHGGTVYPEFRRNMLACGLERKFHAVVKESTEAAKLFDKRSLDFVFIDGAHDYEAVCADIRAWLPKVKPGGTIAGHDRFLQTVERAVQDHLPGFITIGASWSYDVPLHGAPAPYFAA